MNKSMWKVLILVLWVLFIGVSMIKPAEAKVVKKITPKVVEMAVVAAPYSTGDILALTNQERTRLGLSKVVVNNKLNQAAQARVQSMIKQNYFGHVSPKKETLASFLKSSGYNYKHAGENIAMQYTTASSLFNAWLISPSHRQNLVNPAFTDIGVGIIYGEVGGRTGWFVVQLFGNKL